MRGTTVILVTAANDQEVVLAVEELLRRDLNPILVLVDQSSFGGRGDVAVIREKIQALGVSVFTLRRDEDLRIALELKRYQATLGIESPFSYFCFLRQAERSLWCMHNDRPDFAL